MILGMNAGITTHRDGEIIGHTVVRGCEIRNAGVCGIAGLFATDLRLRII